MANKFLGALGLDVLVNKIKDVIAKLDTKQDNFQCFDLYPTSADWRLSESEIEQIIANGSTVIIRWHGVTVSSVDDNIYGPDSVLVGQYTGNNNDTILVQAGNELTGMVFYDNKIYVTNGIVSGLSNPASWSNNVNSTRLMYIETKPTVRFNNSKLQVFNGTEWVDFEFPTGTTVEEITAEEVTNKFA